MLPEAPLPTVGQIRGGGLREELLARGAVELHRHDRQGRIRAASTLRYVQEAQVSGCRLSGGSSKIEIVPLDVRSESHQKIATNLKSICLNRVYASPKWDGTRCSEE